MARTSLNSGHLLKKFKGLNRRDRLSSLPDDLLCKILSNLSTEDSVRTSVLSKRWRNLWLYVPALDLDLDSDNFLDVYEFMDFFLESNKNLDLNRFKLIYNVSEHCNVSLMARMDEVFKRRVCHLTVLNELDGEEVLVRMPLSVYSCPTLVNLTLFGVELDRSELAPVFFPRLKTVHLEGVKFDGDCVLEALISNCSVLEDFVMVIHPGDDYLDVIHVRSKSLRSFKLVSTCGEDCEEDERPSDHDVQVGAPCLEHMSIIGYKAFSFVIESVGPNANVNIDVEFDDPSESTMIFNFFAGMSTLGEMTISARTLKMLDDYRRWESSLPQFSNLSCLHASLCASSWKMLPRFLGCCPNLHSLVLEFDSLPEAEKMKTSFVPPCFVSSLEFVQLKTPLQETSNKEKLAGYFVRNCKVLKELTLNGSFRNIIESIRKIQRRSPECKIVMWKWL